jgi:DNA-directed RNA polymerase specialized sigma24 family protein
MFGRKQSRETQFATCKDFQKIFTEEMDSLHLLALMLTADQQKAEQCFVAGLEDSIHGNPVFRQWARSWSKRAIIKNAIKALAPAAQNDATEASGLKAATAAKSGDAQKDAMLAAVLELGTFSRFVFVMAVLENYSDRECSALLGSTAQDVVAAKAQAIRFMASRQLVAASENKALRIRRLPMLAGDAA